MTGEHLDLPTVQRFGARDLSRERMFDVGWHLFLCEQCRRLLPQAGPQAEELFDRMFAGETFSVPPGAYTEVTRRVAERLRSKGIELERERATAPELWNELEKHPSPRRLWMVENLSRFQTFALSEHLLDRCRTVWSESPARAEELAELALVVIYQLDPQLHGAALLNDFKAETWSCIANCRRIRSDLRSVSEAFDIAEEFHALGSGDPIEEANLLDLKASFLRDQRRFDEAISAIDRVILTYESVGDRHRVGRALVKRATILRQLDRLFEAIADLERASQLIDRGRDPSLVFCLMNNLALYLTEAGSRDEARDLLPVVRELAARLGTRLDRLRFLWTEGLVCWRLGQKELAEAALRQAAEGFVDEGVDYDAALATLDLATLLLEGQRYSEAKELARSMMPIFVSRSVHREALAAFVVVQRASTGEQVAGDLIRELSSYLERARTRPRPRT